VKRREFIAALGGASAWPLAAHAQKPAMPVIGFLQSSAPDMNSDYLRAFRQGLKEAGFVEGESVVIAYRWAEDEADRLPALATELVRRPVAVIGKNELVPASRRGVAKRLTFQGAFKVAILARLLKIGLPPTRAWAITMVFTELGSVSGAQSDRFPGQLFKYNETYLSAADDGVGRVTQGPPFGLLASGTVTICINLNKIYAGLEAALRQESS
jgi:hypothetical protein